MKNNEEIREIFLARIVRDSQLQLHKKSTDIDEMSIETQHHLSNSFIGVIFTLESSCTDFVRIKQLQSLLPVLPCVQ